MFRSSPSLVPAAEGHTFYVVIEQFGGDGIISEIRLDRTSLEDVLADLTAGQYDRPLEVIAFNPTEGWSRNVNADIATELQHRADIADVDVPSLLVDFVARHTKPERQLTLRLV